MTVKVLLVINELDWFWSHRLPLAQAILDRGWSLYLASHESKGDKRLTKLGIQTSDLPRFGKFYNPIPHIRFAVAAARTIRRVRPDVIHTITLRYALYLGLVTRFIRYKPVIFTIAGLGSLFSSSSLRIRLLRTISKPILKFAFGGKHSFIIFQNPDDKEIMLSAGILSEDNTALIRGSGVDLKAYPKVPYQETNDSPVILFASRLLKDKGILDFINAARILKSEEIDAKFVVAGDLIANNRRFINLDEIQEPHEQGIVEWLGKVPNIQKLLERTMIFVFPSYYGEGVPKVLLEAASTGRPLITCDVPGCREVVQHGVNGVLIPPKDPQKLADCLRELIEDREKREIYGSQSRKIAEKYFGTGLVVEKTLDVYDKALATSEI